MDEHAESIMLPCCFHLISSHFILSRGQESGRKKKKEKRKILSDSGNFIFKAPAHRFPLRRAEHIQLWPLPPLADNFIITYSFEVDLLLHLCSHDTIIFSTFISEVALLESVSSNPLPPHLLLILSLLSETLHRLTSYFGLSVIIITINAAYCKCNYIMHYYYASIKRTLH